MPHCASFMSGDIVGEKKEDLAPRGNNVFISSELKACTQRDSYKNIFGSIFFFFYMGLTVMIQLATVQLSNVHFTKVQCVLQGDG